MAIGVIFDGVGVSQAQYDLVRNQVSPDDQLADGLLSHTAGVNEQGVFVFEVWESQEALQRFFQEQLGAALQDAKITVQPRFVEIVKTMPA